MFKLKQDYNPTGDQPQAIDQLVAGLNAGLKHQVLLGVTGSGKTFTMANVINQVQKPTLVLAHNKTLAAQLFAEYREFFPDNAVKYFVSYYDYYQPEAYLPHKDIYIEKEVQINEEIEKYRNAATQALLTRKDVIIVASVSCIYGLGNPEDYLSLSRTVRVGGHYFRNKLLRHLLDIQYERNDMDFHRGTFRVKGDVLDIYLAYEDHALRIEYFGDDIEKISIIHPLTGEVLETPKEFTIFPAKHYVTPFEKLLEAIPEIEKELKSQYDYFKKRGKEVEAQRLKQRVNYDIEMLREVGYCSGIENYSRFIENREVGEPPSTLLDYFPDDYLMIIDESHMTIPQVGGMYHGDRARKERLVEYGFRLPSAMDNRPLRFEEFEERLNQTIYTTATPREWELNKAKESTKAYQKTNCHPEPVYLEHNRKEERQRKKDVILSLAKDDINQKKEGSPLLPFNKLRVTAHKTRPDIVCNHNGIIEQIIRPTGLLDPSVEIRPTKYQVDDLINEIQKTVKKGQRVLVTTLTKRMSEDLTDYLKDLDIKVQYLHSEVETIERVEILRDLRKGVYDVLVGINLLREGIDLPEVSLVAILDADKEGFLRSYSALVQIMGRAARHVEGHVIMYADRKTNSMKKAIKETNRRRSIQEEYNKKHGITPKSIKKEIREQLLRTTPDKDKDRTIKIDIDTIPIDELRKLTHMLENKMELAAKELRFEDAANLRDEIEEIKKSIKS